MASFGRVLSKRRFGFADVNRAIDFVVLLAMAAVTT
jgi:hypothetical protein